MHRAPDEKDQVPSFKAQCLAAMAAQQWQTFLGKVWCMTDMGLSENGI
jgi:hypothetical protein